MSAFIVGEEDEDNDDGGQQSEVDIDLIPDDDRAGDGS
jgi:hypothetical protein